MPRKKRVKRPTPKGHWPLGKRRNKDGGTWSRTRLSLWTLIEEHFLPKVRSRIAAAAAIGVSDRTVRRWLDGTDVPAEESQAIVRRWCAEQFAAIKARRTRRRG